MDTKKIKETIDILNHDLSGGLISCDIWVIGTGQPIFSFKDANLKAAALFDQITQSINKALKIAEFPEIESYYLLHLDNGTMIVMLQKDKYQWGLAIDPEKAPLGLVLNVAIPNVMESLN